MKTIKKALMVIVVFLCLISFVHAQDYSLFSGKFYDLKEGEAKIEFEFFNGTYDICENEKKTIPILVVNKDAKIDNSYSLGVVGASWINLNVKEFPLPKKQSGVAFLNLNPEENTNGKYNVKISSTSSIGDVERELNLDINVEKCHSLNLELEKEEDKICGGAKKQYSGIITNNGRKSDVELIVKGPNWINVDKNIFSIDSGGNEKFEINADVPANAKGFFDVFLSAVITNLPSISSTKNLRIEVVPKYDCYKADILADAKIKNYYSNEYVLVKIRNSGVKQAVYSVNLEAPNWISIEPEELTVNPEQLGNLNLNINPNAEIEEGTYAIKINISYNDIVYATNIDVTLSKNQFSQVKSFFAFYQYYVYLILFILIILFIFRRQIVNKIKTTYKNYKVRKARQRALEVAREKRFVKKK